MRLNAYFVNNSLEILQNIGLYGGNALDFVDIKSFCGNILQNKRTNIFSCEEGVILRTLSCFYGAVFHRYDREGLFFRAFQNDGVENVLEAAALKGDVIQRAVAAPDVTKRQVQNFSRFSEFTVSYRDVTGRFTDDGAHIAVVKENGFAKISVLSDLGLHAVFLLLVRE